MNQSRKLKFVVTIVLLLLSVRTYAEQLQNYVKQEGVFGNISSVGSDTLSGMMTLWVEEFNQLYPGVTIQVQASGSATAPPALTEGTAQLGPMSRPMRRREIDAFVAHYGYKPTQLRVAIDAIGIYINHDNPIKGLDISQLDSIYSATLRCGATKSVTKWSQLGLKYEWAKRSIQLFGRNSASGTYGYFKDHALCGGDYKSRVNALPGSSSVIQSVASAINTIGYSGWGIVQQEYVCCQLQERGVTMFIQAANTFFQESTLYLVTFMCMSISLRKSLYLKLSKSSSPSYFLSKGSL